MTRLPLLSVTLGLVLLSSPLGAEAQTTTASPTVTSSKSALPRAGAALPPAAKSRMKFVPFNEQAFREVAESRAAPQGTRGHSGRGRAETERGAHSPQAYGSGATKWPYTVARVANQSDQASFATIDSPVSAQPYRSTGKLYARWGASWYVCTASLVKRGVLLTAAHCVHDFGLGVAGFADEVFWIPANSAPGGGAFGVYTSLELRVPTPYLNGTDTCTQVGVVCNNDIATVVLNARSGTHAGDALGGWYAYGWNGYSYVANSAMGRATVADITQLGYPVSFDQGFQMQRNNSFGKYVSQRAKNRKNLLNTQMGSALTGGSSGGPWIVNFGVAPSIDGGASLGLQDARNMVVGVTSWAYASTGINIQGASWFGQNAEFTAAAYGTYGAGNIGKLMYDTCTSHPSQC
jgi:V8-like Glu-specific endopeptidase